MWMLIWLVHHGQIQSIYFADDTTGHPKKTSAREGGAQEADMVERGSRRSGRVAGLVMIENADIGREGSQKLVKSCRRLLWMAPKVL